MRRFAPLYRLMIAVITLSFFAGCGALAPMIVTVNFGTPPQGGGACTGKGICSAVMQGPGTKVTLLLSPIDKDVLVMKFSMKELKANQPEQAQNFVDGGSYAFDTTYSFVDQMYAPLKLPPNSRIEVTTKSEVRIKDDAVVVSYHFEHDVQQ